MATRYAVQFGLTFGPAGDLTHKGAVTYLTVAAELNTPEGIMRLHAEVAAKLEAADAELIHTTPAEVVEVPD